MSGGAFGMHHSLLTYWPIVVIGATVLAIVAAVLRAPRGLRVHDGKFLQILHQESDQHGSGPFRVEQSNATDSDGNGRLIWSAVGIDALNAPITAWEQWNNVDPHLFDAFTQLTHESVNNLADLTRVVDDNHYHVASEHFIENIKGHLGEWQVDADFSHLHPVMAETSNYAATDLWLQGHAANVKTVADAGPTLTEHFSRYPDVAAIVPMDAHHIPADALYYHPGDRISPSIFADGHATIVDTQLSNAEMLAHTHQGLDAVAHPAGGFAVPWFTLAITGFAEGKLLLQGDTDFERAAITTLGTAASVGTASFAGKVIGAHIGGAIVPGVGAIGGAIVGGVAGAFGGRFFVNAIKGRRLRNIASEFDASQQSYQRKADEVGRWAQNEWTAGLASITSELQTALATVMHQADEHFGAARTAINASNSLSKSEAETQLSDTADLVDTQMRRMRKWMQVPGLRALLSRRHASLLEWKARSTALLQNWAASPEEVAALFDLKMVSRNGETSARAYIRNYFAIKGRIYDVAIQIGDTAYRDALRRRVEAVAESRVVWARIDKEASSKMQIYRMSLRTKAEALRRELVALGAKDGEPAQKLNELLALPPPQ